MMNKTQSDKKQHLITLSTIQSIFSKKEKDLRIPFESFTKREKNILLKTVKLSEEVGELSNDVLATLSLQRKSKLDEFEIQNLYEEFADVVLTVASLANAMRVDLNRAVQKKLDKVLEVYTKDK